MNFIKFIYSFLSIGNVLSTVIQTEPNKHTHTTSSFLGNSESFYNYDISTIQKDLTYNTNFNIYPSEFQNGEDVTVEWENMPQNENSFLGLSCGKTINDNDFLDSVSIGNMSETGEYIFQNLINMRCNYTIDYYQTHQNQTNILARKIISPIQGFNIPMHIHTSLTNHPNERVISWTSNTDYIPQVKLWSWREFKNYDTYENTYILFNGTVIDKYTQNMMCGSPANSTSQEWFRDPGYQKKVVINNLNAEDLYFYSVGDEIDGWSDKYHLFIKENSKTNTKFIAYGDLGIDQPNAGQGTINRILDRDDLDTHFLLHFGDISYARGKGWIWERFFNMIEPLARHTPYMVSIGNHEYDHTGQPHKDPSGIKDGGFQPYWGNYGDDSGGECSVPMYYRFHMPENGNALYWYSFNYSLIHVIQLSTEHDFTYNSPQYKWLKNDLENIDRKITPYVVITGHRPMYTSEMTYKADYIVSLAMQTELEDLFYKYSVDLALWGHYHSYERTCPVYKQTCDTKGTAHIVVGTAGAGIEEGTFGGKHFEWSKASGLEWGYLAVTADTQEIHIEYVRNSDGSIKDEAYLPNRFQ